MKRKGSISIGPGAASLILIFVMLSMSVLAMLSVMTSRGDVRLGERSIEVAMSAAALNERAEEDFAALDEILRECRENSSDFVSYLQAVAAALPAGMKLEQNGGAVGVAWTVEDEERALDLAVQLCDYEDETRAVWLRHNLSAGGEDEWNW